VTSVGEKNRLGEPSSKVYATLLYRSGTAARKGRGELDDYGSQGIGSDKGRNDVKKKVR